MRARLRVLWAAWLMRHHERQALAFHHHMGHSCSFCQPKPKGGRT